MNIKVFIICLFIFFNSTANIYSQIVEREIPKEWDGLIEGGRFMDLFLPIPIQGSLTKETWGTDTVIPRDIENGIEDPEWSYWGGNITVTDDGKHHLFVARWREDSSKGHWEWPNSTVIHAVCDNSIGPYKFKDIVGPGHNPEIFQLRDGRYVIYVIDAYYISRSISGPWIKQKFDFDPRDRPIIEGLSNLTFAQREDGSFLMVCRGGGVWLSQTGISPYYQVTQESVYPPVDGRFEDPVIWRDNIQYHMIVNDWYGRIAYYLRSKDGIRWKVDSGMAYMPGIAVYEDGTRVDWFKYERIKILQDNLGRAIQANFAVIDVLKSEDKGNDNHSSKNISIPLLAGRQIEIIQKDKINNNTQNIKVKVIAEKGFNPQEDIDLSSVRFGSPEEVDFGRGSKLSTTFKSGTDIILTFEGNGNGLTEENFVGKLLGKSNEGKLLFGYARLPGVTYIEPELSARKPIFKRVKEGWKIEVEVQNLGQVKSNPTDIIVELVRDNAYVVIASGKISSLKSFERVTKTFLTKELLTGVEHKVRIAIVPVHQKTSYLDSKIKILR